MDSVERLPRWRCAAERLVTDYPSAILTLHRRGTTTRVSYYLGDPCALGAVRRAVNDVGRVAGTSHYVPSVMPDDMAE